MKGLYELLTYSLSVINDPIWDFIIITVLGSLSFVIAWNFVGETGIRGKAGSIIHWTVRIIVMFILCFITSLVFKIGIYVASISVFTWIKIGSIFLTLIIIGITVYFSFFSKKEKLYRLKNNNEKEYISLCKKIINNYYLNLSNRINKKDINDWPYNEFVKKELIDLLKSKKIIIDNNDNYEISFSTVIYLEEIVNSYMNHSVTSLALMIALFTFIVSIFDKFNNVIFDFVSIILFISLLFMIKDVVPKEGKMKNAKIRD